MNPLADLATERDLRTTRATAETQIRMSALIELAMHNARLAVTSGDERDVISRARADLRNAVARLERAQ